MAPGTWSLRHAQDHTRSKLPESRWKEGPLQVEALSRQNCANSTALALAPSNGSTYLRKESSQGLGPHSAWGERKLAGFGVPNSPQSESLQGQGFRATKPDTHSNPRVTHHSSFPQSTLPPQHNEVNPL